MKTHPIRRTWRPQERGSVIVVALLVILALSGLGIVALNRALTATLTASTFNINKQANYVAELAIQGSIEELACAPDRYLTPMTLVQQLPGGRTANTSIQWNGTSFCGAEMTWYGDGAFGRRDNLPRIAVSYSDNRLANDEAGYEAGGAGSSGSDQPCHIRMRVDAQGVMNIPGRTSDAFVEGQADRTDVVRRATGYITVGPFLNSAICANAGAL